MSNDKVCVELSKAEALVLFEFLSRFSDMEKLEITDQAETDVLINILYSLERVLVEPFSPSYDRFVADARNHIRSKE